MELNEVHTDHEQASTSLKALLLVFAGVIIIALGYLVWSANTAPDTTDNSGVIIKKVTTTTTTVKTVVADNTVACGDKAYAYSLTFGDLWTGYKIKEVKPTNGEAIVYCYFNMPTTDAAYATASSTNLAGYASVFAVGVYAPTQWAALAVTPGQGTKLASGASYVWDYSEAQADPLAFTALRDDVKNIIATFKIN